MNNPIGWVSDPVCEDRNLLVGHPSPAAQKIYEAGCPLPATRLPAGALYLRRTDVELLRPVRNRRKITAAHVWVHAPPPRAQAVGRAAEREVDVPGRSLGLARCFKCRICQHAHFANICQNFLWQLCCIGTNFCNQL